MLAAPAAIPPAPTYIQGIHGATPQGRRTVVLPEEHPDNPQSLNRYLDYQNMKKKTKYSECMTLRLEPHIDQQVIEASYDSRLSKADWVRRAIRRGLQEKLPKKMAWAEPVLR